MEKIGNCYYHGIGTARDYKKAFELYKELAERGYVKALMDNASIIMKAAQLDNDIICGVAEDYQYKAFEGGFFAEIITDFNELTPEERMVHEDVSVLFIVDRGITHEIVRHRDASFAQESTRYCNYNLGKFDNEITVIEPCFFNKNEEPIDKLSWSKYKHWKEACLMSENAYFNLLKAGATPQEARDVLPTSVKAEIVVTTNLHEWRHILNLRACDSTGSAHPQIKEVMIPLFKEMKPIYSFALEDMIAANEVTK